MKFLIDGHCDTIEKALDNKLSLQDKKLSFNLCDAAQLNIPIIQMAAAFISPGNQNSFQRAKTIFKYFFEQKEKLGDKIIQIQSNNDIDKVIAENKLGIVLTIENGSAIEDNLDNVDFFCHQGVKVMSITWNNDNLLGCGALTKNDNGLTEFGKKYIQKLNQKNMLIDVSHSSQKTFWDTSKISEDTVVATHSCCYHLCSHPRNLTDEQIRQIAAMNGIIGICYCTQFLSETGRATTKEIVDHIDYIANLVGIDYVGLGSDFDGLEEEDIPKNLKGISQINNLIQELQNRGFDEDEIQKILGENWLRVLQTRKTILS